MQINENRGLKDDGRTMIREFRDQYRKNSESSVTTDFVYLLETAGIEHTLLFGGDYFVGDGEYTANIGRGAPSNIPDIDIISPVYGADPLHFGYFAGFYSKIVYFVFEIILSALAITGSYLYGLHYTRIKRQQTVAHKRIWYTAWQGMKAWKWLSIFLLAICAILTIFIFYYR